MLTPTKVNQIRCPIVVKKVGGDMLFNCDPKTLIAAGFGDKPTYEYYGAPVVALSLNELEALQRQGIVQVITLAKQ